MDAYKTQSFRDVKIGNGFWSGKQKLIAERSVYAVYDRFEETGRFSIYDFTWKKGDPNEPHIYWDSDVAKWIESVAYIVQKKDDPELVRRCDDIIARIEKHQEDTGYFNTHYQLVEPLSRFSNRECHELYCCGHFIEAAVAYYYATGKDRLLRCMEKYVDYIEKRFVTDHDTSFTTPGCEEIELALIKLYCLTRKEKYLRLSKFFIDNRGCSIKDHIQLNGAGLMQRQDHKPVREQDEAVGHAVRAAYLYSGMADVARETNDETLLDACKKLFSDIVEKKLYITGGIGASSFGEAFSCQYDLPNVDAYTESCAAIALAFFAIRMQRSDNRTVYADLVERIIYNGFLSSVSLDGEKFFYENPLEYDRRLFDRYAVKNNSQHLPITERQKVFWCSCCPPNITRFVPSIGDYIYSYTDSRINILQYIASETEINGRKIRIDTDFPKSGNVRITVGAGAPCELALRIPEWCSKYTASANKGVSENWLLFDIGSEEETVEFNMDMPVKFYSSRTEVRSNCGRIAVMRGPVLYCGESADNGLDLRDIKLDVSCRPELMFSDEYNAYTIEIDGTRSVRNSGDLYFEYDPERIGAKVRLIPYFAFSNRENTEMLVWFDHS